VIGTIRCDEREAASIGRSAHLELVFERRGNRTILVHAYAEPPFRIGRAFAVGDAAYVIVACTGPGVFAGDTLRQAVRVEKGARAVLASQAALQAHPSAAAAAACIHHDVQVADGGVLHAHWDPLIPFGRARIDQRFDLHLGDAAALYWSDALMAGRVTRGERWRFNEVAHQLTLRVAGRLQYLERYRLRPSDSDPTRPWIAPAAYLGTTLLRGAGATGKTAEMLHRALADIDDISAAVDLVEPQLAVARLAAGSGPPFARGRGELQRLAAVSIFDTPPFVSRK